MNIDYSDLYQSLGYHFQDKNLMKLALTHRSKDKRNNERLEFLGDSILNFVIAEALYKKFTNVNEGTMSLLRTSLVRGKMLTKLAKNLNLGKYILFGLGESSSGYKRNRLLEDAFEAMIGAIYLDSKSINQVKKIILFLYHPFIKIINLSQPNKDPKSQLQEYLQAKIKKYPIYTLISTEGLEHDKLFTVKVCLVHLNIFFLEKVSLVNKQNMQQLKMLLMKLYSIKNEK